jgi:DNA-binding CsgD family transcriptional regulator
VDDFALQVIEETLSSPKSKQELIEILNISERTLRYKLSILKKKGKIKERGIITDLRKKIFYLNKEEKI